MKPQILLVEDNPITRKMVTFTLASKDIDVVEAPDGAAALRFAASQAFDLVLQDVILPDLDGFDLVRQLRAIAGLQDIPILAFTGFLSKLESAQLEGVGFTDVVTKPIQPSQLLRIVQSHLPTASATARVVGSNQVVVLADDDAVQRKLTSFRLEKMGFKVVSVNDGVEALERVRARKPDVLVSDVMMPRLDGFGLCAAIRHEPALADLRVVLMSNTYIDMEDRELATRAGADQFVLRTPDLKGLADALEHVLAMRRVNPGVPLQDSEDFERARVHRALRQLETQVAANAGLTQQCALLSAQLSILSAISEAVAREEDIESVLREALAACFDSGGISVGALYLWPPDGAPPSIYQVGHHSEWNSDSLTSFFGYIALLRSIVQSGQTTTLSASTPSTNGDVHALLAQSGLQSVLIVPVLKESGRFGALVMMSKTMDLTDDDRIAFAQAVANQISLALRLARTFEEKDESERKARTQTSVLESVIDGVPDGLVMADRTGRYLVWNTAAESIVRLGPAFVAPPEGSERIGLFMPDRVTRFLPEELPLAKAMRGEKVDRAEMFMRNELTPQGKWLSVNARPLRDAQGDISGGVAVLHDITEEKAAQEQLVTSDRMVSIGMLAAGVAHEINNPLACVMGNVEMSLLELSGSNERQKTPDLGELHEMLSEALEGAGRVRQIVRDLKIFARAEQESSTAIAVEAVLDSSLRMAWNEIRHRARVVKNYGDVPRVSGTESRLGQVFLNLLVNAAQAIPEGQASQNEIRVTTSVNDAGHVLVDISDTGSGIPPHVLRRLFTPFLTTKPIGVGTGLGLSICQRLVTAMGGEITVQTEVGEGTTFHVALQPATFEQPQSAPAEEPVADGRRGRILVVDDEPMIGSIVRRALAEHEVVTTTDAHEAFRQISGGASFDVILCDLMMPNMTGMQFHEHVMRLSPKLASRVVFLSGGAFTAEARAFIDTVANRRIDKPFSSVELRAAIAQQLGRSAQADV